jgi:4-hydroxymandelate oxidase
MAEGEMLTLDDFESAARSMLDPGIVAYVAGGAGGGRSVDANRAALAEMWLQPRVAARAVAEPATTVTLLDRPLAMPVLLAPTSPVRLLHRDAETAVARAAAGAGVVSVVSTDSHEPYPDVADAVAPGSTWFQLYAYRSRADTERTVDMAIAAGAGALVVTVDASFAARRVTARRAGFVPPDHVDFGTLRLLGLFDGALPPGARLDRLPVTWDDLAWLRERCTIPLVVKGILHPDDARACVDLGADAIIVSNHGGRQLDGAVPGVRALPAVADAVARAAGDRAATGCAVLVDGGIRSGVDVVRALALGARAVCLGRPYLWGLALGGQAGVAAVLDLVEGELRDALRQLGLASVADISPDCLAPGRWSPTPGGPS